MNLIGLDVGFSATRHSSGIARLAFGEVTVGCASVSLESRRKFFGADKFDLAAIDAPILPVENYAQRACERLFTFGCFQRRCKPGLSHVPGTGRAFRQAGYESAQQLALMTSGRELRGNFPRVWACHNLIEAFPNAFMGVLLPVACFDSIPKIRRGRKFEWLYEQCGKQHIFDAVVDAIGKAGLSSVLDAIKSNQNHDQKAALICLLTAAGVAANRYTAVGDSQAGYFFLPAWDLWASWARQELVNQRRRIDVDVWIDGKRFSALDSLP